MARNSAEERFATIAAAELRIPGVSAGTGFGSNAGLRVSARIYAMVVRGELVVKLPKERVAELVASGVASHFDAGKGRPMKEWAAVPLNASRRWRALVDEARRFVGAR
jgi:TfoX/Sxy family transcriptional regulator of competence genes